MNIFGKKEQTVIEVRRPRKKKTAADLLNQTLLKVYKDNPELRISSALKQSGDIEEYRRLTDPVEKKKKQLNELVTNEAFSLIQSDPEMRKQYATMMAESIMAGASGNGKSGNSSSPIEKLLDDLKKFKELKEELKDEDGNGNVVPSGWMSTFQQMLAQPEMASVLAGIFANAFGGSKQTIVNSGQRNYVVMVDNKLTELTESQYTEMVKNGRIKPIALLEQPKPIEKDQDKSKKQEQSVAKVTVTEAIDNPELPEWAKLFQFDTLEGYLELSPDEFVNQLKIEVEGGNAPQLQTLWTLLTSTDYDTIIKVLEPYKNHSKAGKFIQKLFEKKEWIEQVMNIIKDGAKLV